MAQEIGIGAEFQELAKERVALAEARLKAKVEQYQKEQL
jgi:hypothetical protein